jgi:hypothetical protein
MRVSRKDLRALLTQPVGAVAGELRLVSRGHEIPTSFDFDRSKQDMVVARGDEHGRVTIERDIMARRLSADSWGETVELEDVEPVVTAWTPKDAA